MLCEVKFAPFSSRCRKSPQPDRRQKELRRQLKDALEAVIIGVSGFILSFFYEI